MVYPQTGFSSTDSRSNWNLEMLAFVEGGKLENPAKNPRSRDDNQQQTQPTYGANSGIQTQATLVEGKLFLCVFTKSILMAVNCFLLWSYFPSYVQR